MTRADSLVQAFYEDPDLRDSLTDDEAEVLLRWAGEQAARLDASGADDAAFEALAAELRRLVKQINRYAGEGAYAPPEAQSAALSGIAAGAQAVGLNMIPTFSAQAAPADPMSALTGLLGSLTPAETLTPLAEPPAPPTDEEFHDL
jgi:hypothetical protein